MRTLVNVLATCSIILWVFMVIGIPAGFIFTYSILGWPESEYRILGWPESGFIAGFVAGFTGFVSKHAKIDIATGRSFPIGVNLFYWLLVIIGFVGVGGFVVLVLGWQLECLLSHC